MPSKPLSVNNLRLLVVDDDPDTRRILAILFKLEGAKIITVASAAEALEVMLYFQPDVFICDICLPNEDGYSLLKKVRTLSQEQRRPQIPAIAMTAFVDEEHHAHAFLTGFQSHLYKPIDLKLLVDVVANLTKSTSNCS
ncbi:MAG: response regulator [Desmonostoc geniculatum HA4340-LM1]|jgi:CheY-like chemotaxis protein|nr:response regulator [Desmonostoc geniculatum HA4340-LM1]